MLHLSMFFFICFIRLLVVVPILSTVNDIKVALCLLLDGSVKPDNVVIAHVKNHTIISTLVSNLTAATVM